MLSLGAILTICFQVSSAVFNQVYRRINSEKSNDLRQSTTREIQQEEFECDLKRFYRQCARQKDFEMEAHKERLANLEKNFRESFSLMAHAKALDNYSLNVSPYVIKNNIINLDSVLFPIERTGLFCVLSTSNVSLFNCDIFPKLDSSFNYLLSRYWNANTTHKVCSYEGMWKRNIAFDYAYVNNLQSFIPSPTLMITPWFVKRDGGYGLNLLINVWGNGNKFSVEYEYDNFILKKPINGQYYSSREVDALVEAILPTMICVLGYIVDNYYWANYYEEPLLPRLVSECNILNDKELLLMVDEAYKYMVDVYVFGQNKNIKYLPFSDSLVSGVANLNNVNFPDRSCRLLKATLPFLTCANDSDKIILNAYETIYKANHDLNITSLDDIVINRVDYDDMNIILEMANLSKKCGSEYLAKQFKNIITKKLENW